MMKNFELIRLAASVKWWLNYNSEIGREYILNEGMLKQPIAEYLERSKISGIQLEYNHPQLSQKRIDIHCTDDAKHSKIYIELKYIKNGSTKNQSEKQRIFNDLMRLWLLATLDTNSSAEHLFLICGNQREFVPNFELIKPPPERIITHTVKQNKKPIKASGFYTEWFSFDLKKPEKNINLKSRKLEYTAIYKEFLKNYQKPYYDKLQQALILPEKIKTKLLYISPLLSVNGTDFSSPTKIGIWKVLKT